MTRDRTPDHAEDAAESHTVGEDRTDRVCIVGAGPGGLAAARWARELGLSFEVLERHSDLGGIWDASRAETPIYDSVHFISSKTLSGYRGFPMPEGYPDYPRHEQILRYLRSFADEWDLRGAIEFGVHVASAEPREGAWLVTLASGEARRYGALVVANGHNWEPNRPDYPGDFAGDLLHSLDYRSPEMFRDRRALIVGGGNSGCDIAVDAALHARRAFLSVRRGYHFLPKHVFGVPSDVFSENGPHLPNWISQPIFQGLLRMIVGDPRRLGLPKPDHRIFETHPIMNTQVLHSLSHGDLEVKSDVRELRGRHVIFADGSKEAIDLIVLATGYLHSIPFLPDTVFRTGVRSNLFLNVFHDEHPNLFVIGLFENDGGAFPVLDRQAELVMRVLDARRSRSEKAEAFSATQRNGHRDFTDGVRHLGIRRMSTYVMTQPYLKYLKKVSALLQ